MNRTLNATAAAAPVAVLVYLMLTTAASGQPPAGGFRVLNPDPSPAKGYRADAPPPFRVLNPAREEELSPRRPDRRPDYSPTPQPRPDVRLSPRPQPERDRTPGPTDRRPAGAFVAMFGTADCPGCRASENSVRIAREKGLQVLKYRGTREAAAKYGFRTLPTFIVFGPETDRRRYGSSLVPGRNGLRSSDLLIRWFNEQVRSGPAPDRGPIAAPAVSQPVPSVRRPAVTVWQTSPPVVVEEVWYETPGTVCGPAGCPVPGY